MIRLTVEQGRSSAVMLLVAVSVLVALVLLSLRSRQQVAAGRWWRLLALKGAAALVMVDLLFRPVLSLERDVGQRRHLVLLVDQSASMSTADDATRTTRFEQARGLALDWSSKLGAGFDLHVLTFSDQTRPLERAGDLSNLEPTGEATSLSRALYAAGKVAPPRDVEAVVLISDGIHNAAGDPIASARGLGVVVHAIGVGNSLRDSPSYRDVRVQGLECPDQMPVNNKAKLTGRLSQVGLAGQVVKVVLEEDGQAVDQAEVELRDQAVEVPFQYTPTVKGRHTYTVRVPVLSGEKIAENNQRSAISQVIDARLRVLYLEGTLRAEYGALVQRFLSKDPDIEFCALVQTRPNVFAQRSNIEGLDLKGLPNDADTLAKFDVIVLGDLDSTYWKPAAMALLTERVRNGGGLLMMGGYHSLGPGGYGATALEEILPTTLGDREVGQVTTPFLPSLTPAGQAHPIFANIGDFFPTRTAPPRTPGLPPLDGCVRVSAARPGATVLAVLPDDPNAMPVLAVQPVGKGRAAVFTGDTTRNWQQAPRALGQESPFTRFWGQILRWLANRAEAVKTEASVTAQTDKAEYEPDAPITIQAIVRDKEGEGTDKATVTAQVTGPRAVDETVSLSAVSGSSGHYAGTLASRTSGTYTIVVAAQIEEAHVQAEPITAEVGRPNLEFDRLDLDETTLSGIAAATGGQYLQIRSANFLAERLNRTEQRRHVSLEQPLHEPRLGWALVVGLLATEWILRKRYHLR